ncbi:hypothetical protein N6H05_25915 (plasmid) [Sphingobium sp. WTD-1]|uniref:hypothetical protein n=1 Tax=Sphingobium sp. WTD-1 TaxID=2979467 RepID=UPI0024DE0E42|nr:hypothetical protein [Sphingobium sp. WTD-1]WIA59147.1 hypothetical protein N6H05_25915 [Sphingobium sp. WTD-1]
MEQHGAITNADRKACLPIGMGWTFAHRKIAGPPTTKLPDNSICLILNRGGMPSGHLRDLR